MVIPGLEAGGIDNEGLPADHAQADELGHQAEEEKEEEEQAQGLATLPIVALGDGLRLAVLYRKAESLGQAHLQGHPVDHLPIRLAPQGLHHGHQQDGSIAVAAWLPAWPSGQWPGLKTGGYLQGQAATA